MRETGPAPPPRLTVTQRLVVTRLLDKHGEDIEVRPCMYPASVGMLACIGLAIRSTSACEKEWVGPVRNECPTLLCTLAMLLEHCMTYAMRHHN